MTSEPAPAGHPQHRTLAYALLRVALGLNILIHGAVRLPNLEGFENYLHAFFQAADWVPEWVLSIGAFVIPFAEVLIGLTLVLGWFTAPGLLAGSILMIVLTAGSCIAQQWNAVGLQVIYSLVYFVLLWHLDANTKSLDHKSRSPDGPRKPRPKRRRKMRGSA